MEPETFEERIERELYAMNKLMRHGFIPRGNFMFERNGKITDLGATDLDWAIKNL